MQVDRVTPITLPAILAWWDARGIGPMDPALLPPIGYVASIDGTPAAAAWLYQFVGCPVGMIDWLVTRPGLPSHIAREAAREVFQSLAERAEADGITTLFASCDRRAMANEIQAVGFEITGNHNIHLVKHL